MLEQCSVCDACRDSSLLVGPSLRRSSWRSNQSEMNRWKEFQKGQDEWRGGICRGCGANLRLRSKMAWIGKWSAESRQNHQETTLVSAWSRLIHQRNMHLNRQSSEDEVSGLKSHQAPKRIINLKILSFPRILCSQDNCFKCASTALQIVLEECSET